MVKCVTIVIKGKLRIIGRHWFKSDRRYENRQTMIGGIYVHVTYFYMYWTIIQYHVQLYFGTL